MSGGLLGGRWWAAALAVCLAAAAAALVTPVHLPRQSTSTDSAGTLPRTSAEVAPEDLGAFMHSRRWGASLREILEAEAARAREVEEVEQPEINPVLAKMGFVGLIVTGDRSEVLLAAPGGGVGRLAPGDTLPDGRTLVSVTDNSLTLKSEGRPEEVLTLFPPIRSEPAP